MRFIFFKDGDGAPHAVHADNVDELYIKDYGDFVAVKMDYTIAGHQFVTVIKKFDFRNVAEDYLADLIRQLNGEAVK